VGTLDCAAVEPWLVGAAEDMLSSAVTEQIRVHTASCAACREKLVQTRRGREWLLVLKQEPIEPPIDLVAKILARTSRANATGHAIEVPVEAIAPPSRPAWQSSSVVVLRRTLFDPHIALVAAMAFFSISLSLNLLGIRLSSMHVADLAPRNMHRAVTRQYAEVNASVVRYYENLRIVYEVEARVQQLRQAAETSTPAEDEVKPQNQSSNSSRDSSSDMAASHRERMGPDPVKSRMDAAFLQPQVRLARMSNLTDGWVESSAGHTLATPFVPPFETRLVLHPAPQASSCSFHNIYFSVRYFSTQESRLA
jgi:hypothetical protein